MAPSPSSRNKSANSIEATICLAFTNSYFRSTDREIPKTNLQGKVRGNLADGEIEVRVVREAQVMLGDLAEAECSHQDSPLRQDCCGRQAASQGVFRKARPWVTVEVTIGFATFRLIGREAARV